MTDFDPGFAISAFLGVLGLIFIVSWLLKNKTPLGAYAKERSVFVLEGNYRIDSKNKICVFRFEGTRFIVIIGPSDICLIHKAAAPEEGDSSVPSRAVESSAFAHELRNAKKNNGSAIDS